MNTVNKNATKEARELLDYLYSVAGKQIITGQHTQTIPMEEAEHIYKVTGHKPMLRGFELLSYSQNINYDDMTPECLTEIVENRGTVDTAIQWYKETKGIVALCFHWYSPIGGRDKSFYQKNTDFDASKILMVGSDERKAFYHDMDALAEILKRFQDERIPVLWRPFHEADGDWFWWGARGDEVGRELYKLMFDYYVNVKHIDNLIWVWNSPAKEGFPGDEYLDVISRDVYIDKGALTDYKKEYDELMANTGSKKVAALAEVGNVPDIKKLKESRVPWAYYMTWSKEFCLTEEYSSNETLKAMYDSDYSIKM